MKKINLVSYHPDHGLAGGDQQPPPSPSVSGPEAEQPSLSNHSTHEREIACDHNQSSGDVKTNGQIISWPISINQSDQQPGPTAETTLTTAEDESPLPSDDPTERTTRLLLAALRVWELKQGIHDD